MWHCMLLAVRPLLQAVPADAEAQRAAKSEEAASQRQVSTRSEPEESEEDDLLPPDVLEAVIKQSRCAPGQRTTAYAATAA